MNVLSLFDGISCAKVALDRAGIEVKKYYACEIDKHATAVSQRNHPDIVHLGDVRGVLAMPEPMDLLVGGSPCTDLSIAKKGRLGLAGQHSSLFWEYVRIKDLVKPKWFILENVASMPKEDKKTITDTLGVEPVMFNASLVSAQSRKRLFWTNIPFTLPADRGILLKDILQPDGEVDERMVMKGKAYCLTATYSHANTTEAGIRNSVERRQRTLVGMGHIGNTNSQGNRVYSPEGKSATLSANAGGLGAKTGLYGVENGIRKLTPIECERLQGLPDDYTLGVPTTHRYKCLGNAFNVDVVTHILNAVKDCPERA
jgi:DNA (cytosine-5)-methyltransferase 3A